MKFTAVVAIAAFSGAVFASSDKRAPQDDVASILAALRANNPDDADAAAAVQRREAAPQDDVASILAALRENNPDDADAASANIAKRQDDVAGILDALRANSPDDADAAAGLGRRWL